MTRLRELKEIRPRSKYAQAKVALVIHAEAGDFFHVSADGNEQAAVWVPTSHCRKIRNEVEAQCGGRVWTCRIPQWVQLLLARSFLQEQEPSE